MPVRPRPVISWRSTPARIYLQDCWISAIPLQCALNAQAQ